MGRGATIDLATRLSIAPNSEGPVDVRVRYDLKRRLNREISDENREPVKYHAFDLGQQPITPIQRGLQRLLARRRGALTLPQQA